MKRPLLCVVRSSEPHSHEIAAEQTPFANYTVLFGGAQTADEAKANAYIRCGHPPPCQHLVVAHLLANFTDRLFLQLPNSFAR